MKINLLASAAGFAALLAAGPVWAQVNPPSSPPPSAPPAANLTPDSVNGARPGNVIGTGDSLPASNRPSNIDTADTRSQIAPRLPDPDVGAGATPRTYLQAAQQDLAAHRSGAAQQALEMAETRLLDRSVVQSAAMTPDQNPVVGQVQGALDAISHRDMDGAQQQVTAALNSLGNRPTTTTD